jgi:hypothetical protein
MPERVGSFLFSACDRYMANRHASLTRSIAEDGRLFSR